MRCPLHLVLPAGTLLLVALSCFLIWFTNHQAWLNNVDALSEQLKRQCLRDSVRELNTQFLTLLTITQTLGNVVLARDAGLVNATSWRNRSGILTDLETQLELSTIPYTCLILANSHSLSLTMASTPAGRVVVVGHPINSTVGISPQDIIARLSSYAAPILPPTTRPLARPPASFPLNQSFAETLHILGAPLTVARGNLLVQQALWDTVVDLTHEGDRCGWSNPTWAACASNSSMEADTAGCLSLFIVCIDQPSLDRPFLLTSGIVDLATFVSTLAAFPLGDHGAAHLVSLDGTLLASTDALQQQRIVANRGPVDLRTSDTSMSDVAACLLENDLITSSPSSLRDASKAMGAREPRGDEMHACRSSGTLALWIRYDKVGLRLLVVFTTQTSDYYGDFVQATRNSVLISVAIATFGVLLSVGLLHVLVRKPLRNFLRFLDEFASALAVRTDRLLAMERLRDKWRDASNRGRCERNLSELVDIAHAIDGVLFELIDLERSVDSLDSVNRAKREFIRYIFHELRVPFNAVNLSVDLLRMQTSLPQAVVATPSGERLDAVDTLNIIQEQCCVMRRLLDDVLSLQKIEEGAFRLEYTGFDLHKLIRRNCMVHRREFDQKRIVVDVELDPLPDVGGQRVCVAGDRFRLAQVINNLVSNAIKFTPLNGRIRVHLKVDHQSVGVLKTVGEDFVTSLPPALSAVTLGVVSMIVSVTDTGCGIAEADLVHLFQAYMQISPGKLQQGSGTGLGLKICKSLVELHGGSVHVESKLNQGSTFSFQIPFYVLPIRYAYLSSSVSASPRASIDLPGGVPESSVVTVHACDVGPRMTPEPHLPPPPLPANKQRVLVVEDSSPNRKLLCRLLSTLGYVVDSAEDGLLCIAKFPAAGAHPTPYDIVFMDGLMPNMGGFAATKWLRDHGFTMPIIAVTGNALQEDQDAFLLAGANCVLTKPFQLQQLKRALASY